MEKTANASLHSFTLHVTLYTVKGGEVVETRLSSKGQITLPSDVRRRLNIRIGDVLVVKAVGENSIVLEVKRKAPSIAKQEEDILTTTAGLWRNREDITESFLRDLRQSDSKRLGELIDEQHSD